MKELKEFTIPFVGLKLGEHRFNYQIGKAFFEHFEFEEFADAKINVDVVLDKKNTLLDFFIDFEGTVNVPCDLTNEPFDLPIEGQYDFVVKFGEEFNDENEDILVIPHGSHEVNIQQFIYETLVLAVPLKRVHPGVEDGTLKSEILEKLEELSLSEDKQHQSEVEESETDPRWEELKKLLTDK
ncbi:MAG TPA: DUF177 domain-containing protein [Flavobacteriaceae bacterium]|nr:DUF177 domain-containing protein [Flavobacteriaceae bacterium]